MTGRGARNDRKRAGRRRRTDRARPLSPVATARAYPDRVYLRRQRKREPAWPGAQARSASADRANDRHELALDLDIAGRGIDRVHRHVGRLQADAIALAVEPLQRRLLLVLQPDRDGLTVLARLLAPQKDDIPVVDEGVHHRVALDAQREEIAAAVRHQIAAQLDRLRGVAPFEVAGDGDRETGGDLTDHRDADNVVVCVRSADQLDAARDIAVAADEAALLEDLEVVIHDARRRDAQLVLDVADRRWVLVLEQEALDKIEDGAL